MDCEAGVVEGRIWAGLALFRFACRSLLPLVGILLTASLGGCNRAADVVDVPTTTVTINEPESGARIQTGREVEIRSTAMGATPIERVDMYVNDDLIRSDVSPVEGGQYVFNVVQRWVPIRAGEAQVRVIAYDVNGQPSQPAGLVLEIVGEPLATVPPVTAVVVLSGTATALVTSTPIVPVSVGTPMPVGSPPPSATTVEVFTPVPPPTNTPGPAAQEVGGTVAVRSLNVRSGPGQNYQIVGGVRYFDTIRAIGRTPDAGWAQVRYGQNQIGWVSTSFVTWDAPLNELPVVRP